MDVIGLLAVDASMPVVAMPDERMPDERMPDEQIPDEHWRELLSLADDRRLLESDPQCLTHDELLDCLAAVQVQRAVLDALEARALVAAAGIHREVRDVVVLDEFSDDERAIELVDERREEIAAVLHRTPGAVDRQIVLSRLLVGWLRPTLEALECGRISGAHARVIAEQALSLSTSGPCVNQAPDQDSPDDALDRIEFAHACDRLQAYVLPRAAVLTPAQTRTLSRRTVARIDSAGQEARRRRATTQIDVTAYPDCDGLSVVHARMTTADAARVYAALDARARTLLAQPDCPAELTIGQARVRALLDAVLGDGSSSVVTEIQVVIGLDSLLGISDFPATVGVGGKAPESLSCAAVRELLADAATPARLRRLIVDPMTGHLIDRGRSTYAVTSALREFLITRDATCRFPGCARTARACQVDHAVAWSDGGGTDRANLGHLCVRHHQLKTHGGWDILESRANGSATWKSPQGRVFETGPPGLGPPMTL